MDQAVRNNLRGVVLACRSILENAIREELQGRFGIYVSGKSKSINRFMLESADDANFGLQFTSQKTPAFSQRVGVLSLAGSGGRASAAC